MPVNKDLLFLSDLHISLDKPDITRRFLTFLEQRATQATAVYILGDLFDAWIGDDDPTPPNHAIRGQLKKLTDSGVAVYLQPGNRDFLLGQRFADETGVTLLSDYAVIELGGINTLLTHGDLLCTDDLPYQAFRARSRTPEWRHNVLSKPLWLRLLAARWYRLRSYFHKRGKTMEIMDVNQDTVVKTMRDHRCFRLIHGHTHRPGKHEFVIGDQPAQRLILADWRNDFGEVLCWHNNSFKIEQIQLADKYSLKHRLLQLFKI